MIVYQLVCEQGHDFEGWFASAEACGKQVEDGLLECPTCGSPDIARLPSAPHVHIPGSSAAPATVPVTNAAGRREVMAALRKFILENTDDVGRKFAEVARRIHYKEEKARGIRGRVTPEEAVELTEEGVTTFAISAEVISSEEVH